MKKFITLSLSYFLFFSALKAQTYTQLYLQTFGTTSTQWGGQTLSNTNYNTVYPLILTPATSSYGRVAPNSGLLQGNYSITGNYNATANGTSSFAVSSNDHTSGNGTGLFMVIDGNAGRVGEATGQYFQLPVSVEDIPGATYQVTFWMRNMDQASASGFAAAFLNLSVRDNAAGTGTNYVTGGSPFQATVPLGAGWTQQTTTLSIPLDYNSSGSGALYFNFWNPSNAGNGNDLGLDDIQINLQTIASLSGNVYTNDGNGNGASTTLYNGSTSLYAVLVDSSSSVIQSVQVIGGQYTFTTNTTSNSFIPYATSTIGMKIILSTTNPSAGSILSAPSLPANMSSTGGTYPPQTFVENTTGAVMRVTQTSSNITGANFYIENMPIANAVAVSNVAPWQFNVSGASIGQPSYVGIATNSVPAQPLSGTDVEDNVVTAFQIGTIASNTLLYYNGVQLIAGSQITNYDPSRLIVYATKASTGPSFTYYGIDKANILSASPASYSLSSPQPLPITLDSFSVKTLNGNAILNWKGTVENNFSYYEIQRSTDAKNFVSVGKVYGKGSGSLYTYQYPLSAHVEYIRLKMVDNNNTVTYSGILQVNSNCNSEIQPALYPNPTSGKFTINGLGTGNKEILINTINGALVYKGNTNNTQVAINAASWAPGIYLVEISVDGKATTTIKVVKK